MASASPLPDPDQGPLSVNVGLPRADEGAWLPAPGEFQLTAHISTSNHSAEDESGAEQVVLDGETSRAAVHAEFGISDRLALGIEVPYLWHEGGNLDRVIEQWHDWFGLPDGRRALVPEDELEFSYADGGALPLFINRNQRGVGDVRLLAGWQLGRDERRATALRLSVKLPTGSSNRLTGSGATDVALTLAGDYRNLFGSTRWNGFYRFSAVAIGTPDRLAARARSFVGIAGGGLGFHVNDRLELAAQATVRTAAYDSDVRPLGSTAVLLNTGGRLRLTEQLALDISVGEDVAVDTVPDVTFTLALRYAPAASR